MKSEIEPLGSKYYGTIVRILDGKLKGKGIEVWFASGDPSDRELAAESVTREDWDNNVEVDDGWGAGGKCRIKSMFPHDSHYECVNSYRVAQAIVKALSELQ